MGRACVLAGKLEGKAERPSQVSNRYSVCQLVGSRYWLAGASLESLLAGMPDEACAYFRPGTFYVLKSDNPKLRLSAPTSTKQL